MYYESYGNLENPIIVFLHGAFFVHAFGRQYSLKDKYYLLVPHIMGFGREVHKTFQADAAIEELAEFIKGLNRKVMVVGFSLGAQLAVKLITEYEELFTGAIIVSPWLIKDEASLEKAYHENAKQLKNMKNKTRCNIVGMMNGLPKPQRKEFVEQMQHVSEGTLKNIVYNDITLKLVQDFSKVDIPTMALAGGKEQKEVKDSVSCLQKMNDHCQAEIWQKANHNIPPLFHKQFNELIDAFMSEHHG